MGSRILDETNRSESPDNDSQKARNYFETLPEPGPPEFAFVSGMGDTTYRSHAMKSYWRHKKSEQRRQEDTGHTKPALRPLLSRKVRAEDDRDDPSQPQFQPTEDAYSYLHDSSISIKETRVPGIPQQIFSGITFALSSSLDQGADFGGFQISAHHYRSPAVLGLGMHAELIHSGLKPQTFSPFKDIWIPLDLSNSASFNGILAHAAADLNGRREDEDKSEILKFKTEAIGTINLWLSTSTNAIKDEVFAGVVRLLTFEVR
ncbi:hypothetical protein N7481_008481 [Penicillium waksmanii]|uniref:uncharacterized protein n=1 Tax=Penicillium waksmanii TaxID=69791 RepID=UPI002546FB8B|nr:uncharacterized protein N7481_008481 [Penicillium waksmanii]KAJ5974774.1 hypothetical protein N7481_008481 [Penicillium waksmanii]